MTYKSSFVQWPCFFHLVYSNSQKHGKRAPKIYLITFLQKQNIQSTHSIIYDQVLEISEAETLNILTLNICRHWKRSTSWPRCVQRILIWKISRMSANISSGQRLDLNESKVFGCWHLNPTCVLYWIRVNPMQQTLTKLESGRCSTSLERDYSFCSLIRIATMR